MIKLSIPKDWSSQKLAELVQKNNQCNPQHNPDKEFCYVQISNISKYKNIDSYSRILGRNAPSRARKLIQTNDVIYAMTRPYYRNVAIVPSSLHNQVCSTGFCVLRATDTAKLNAKFLFFYLQSDQATNQILQSMRGGNYPAVSNRDLLDILVPLPHIKIQIGIAQKLERVITTIVERHRNISKIFSRKAIYLQSNSEVGFNKNSILFKSCVSMLLLQAMSGKLTADYRRSKNKIQKNSNSYEIQGLSEHPKQDLSFKSRLKNLPKSWIWMPVRKCGEVVTGTTPNSQLEEYYGKDYPFFKPGDLNPGYYTKVSKNGLSKVGIKHARLLPKKSVLVTCIGATIGKTALIRTAGASNQQINSIIPNKYYVIPEYLYYWFASPYGRETIIENATYTTLPILNKSKFQELLIALPPLHEQREIVKRIDKKEKLLSTLSKSISHVMDLQKQSLENLERVQRVIINQAFSHA